MAQHDQVLADQPGAGFRADLNNALAALFSNSSGATEPATMVAYQWWADTTSGWLKQRNAANNAWVNKIPLADAMTATGLALFKAADAAAARTAIGAVIGTDVQAFAASASQAEMEAGTESALRAVSPLRVKQAILALAASSQHGQCRLAKSGASLLLSPLNGNKLIINGTVQTIPSAGVTLAAPATSGTTYFIYAYMNTGTMTLEYSTTGHATDSTTGVEIKSGDATRTLVGMARTVSSAWVDSATQRLVISYFNRRSISAVYAFAAGQSTSSVSFVELNSAYRIEFLTWGDEALQVSGSASVNHSTASWTTNYWAVWLDGGAPAGAYTQGSVGGVGVYANMSVAYSSSAYAEGYHYATGAGATSSGTATYNINYTNYSVTVRG